MKRFAAWLLAAALLAGMPALAAREEAPRDRGETVRVVVLMEGAPLLERPGRGDAPAQEQARLFDAAEDRGVDFEVVYTFDTLLNGFSCDVAYGDLEAMAGLPGVKSVHVANTYGPPDPVEVGPSPRMGQSNALTGNDLTLAEGYTGKGTVVAVLDSGVNLEHEAFQVYDGVLGTPKLTREAVTALVENETVAQGQYISEKIPFGYDYADQDDDPSDTGTEDSARGHGSHVSGIAAGYAERAGEAFFTGAAPGAQLLAMKIYPGDGKGATTDVYFKAMEDAMKLGADVINISLGVNNGFTHDPVLETELGGVFTRLEEAGVLVCASAGNANCMVENSTKGYLDPLYTDYGMVGAPSTFQDNISVASIDNPTAANAQADAAAALAPVCVGKMSKFSSWGPTPSLTLRPTLTSVGGEVNSALWNEPEGYIVQGGTSMSSPNLAGTYATLLSFLDQATAGAEPALTKPQRAALARQLMESAAQVVAPAEGAAPYSVRKQGAGLANSALARKAYASGWLENPIQEVGDSEAGRFTFNFTVKNNTGADITYNTSAVLTTDGARTVDGHRENTLTAQRLFDSTKAADDLGLATVGMAPSVTVNANDEAVVTVTVSLTDEGKACFTDNGFWNGGYVEGYVFLTPADAASDAATLHATVLGYYGDWAQVPAAEVQDFRSYLAAEYAYHTAADNSGKQVIDYLAQPITTTVNMARFENGGGGMLGSNLMSGYTGEGFRGEVAYAPYDPSHLVLSGNKDSCGYDWFYTQPSLLRNVRFIVMDVTDAAGELVSINYPVEAKGNNNYVTRVTYNTTTHTWENHSSNQWYVRGYANGKDGQVVHVDLRVVVPYGADTENPYGQTQDHIWKTLTGYDETTGEPQYETGFDVTLDSTAPEIVSAAFEGRTLTVTVKDAHLAGVYLEEGEGADAKIVDYQLFDETAATLNEDGSWSATFDIPADVAVTEGKVVAYDYARNKTAQAVTYPAQEEPDPTPVTFTVTFRSEDAQNVTVKVNEGETVGEENMPADPVREGYTFDGWFVGETKFTAETVVTADVTAVAKWTKKETPPAPPSPPSGGGGGGGGGGAPAAPAETTQTETRADGAKVTTVTKPDGTKTETVQLPDGAKTETVTAKNGDRTITATDKDGQLVAQVDLPAQPPKAETRFDDVPAGHWADAAIHSAAARKLVNGVGGNQYDMAAPMTRGSLVAVLQRLSHGQTKVEAGFADVRQGAYYADGVAWAAKTGVVTGVSQTAFAPDAPISREQLAVMLARYAKLIGLDTRAQDATLDRFADGGDTGAWATEGVAWCVEQGILQGKGKDALDPGADVTRAEVAVMLERLIALL